MQGEYPNFWREKVPGNPEDRTLLQGTADFLSLRGFDRKGTIQSELEKVKAVVGVEALLNRSSKEYNRLNMQYIVHNREEMMLKHPMLLNTPIVRNGQQATVGYCPDIWREWQ